MKLYYRSTGSGFPLIILHGLYGASDNWMTIVKHLSANNRIILPDLRNHGESPHDDEMDFDCMTKDILELLADLKIEKYILMGHSMGGKLAMKLAFDHPEKIEKLIVIDVAPKSYLKGYSKHFEIHKNIINVMNSLDLSNISSRKEAENKLLEKINSQRTVSFLLKNLKNKKSGGFEWKINIKSIHRNLYKLIDGFEEKNIPEDVIFEKPTLFIKGEKSDYIEDNDMPDIEKKFKNLQFVTIENASHWVHAEQTSKFLDIVSSFISL